MRNVFLLLLVVPSLSWGQSKQPRYEIQEFTGIVKSIEPSLASLSYQRIRIDVNGRIEVLRFNEDRGQFMVNNFKPGDKITVKANVNMTIRDGLRERYNEYIKKYKISMSYEDMVDMWSNDQITELKLNDQWVPFKQPELLPHPYSGNNSIFLEKRVEDIYVSGDFPRAFIFENGHVGNVWRVVVLKSLMGIKKNDVISFMGSNRPIVEGSAYPVPNIKKVNDFILLYKKSGTIKSLLFKQNTACIGMVMSTRDGDFPLSFPSDYAKRVNNFLASGDQVDFYHTWPSDKENIDPLSPPELHAIVHGSDTLTILKYGFSGSADIGHRHKDVVIDGKITKINLSDKGKILTFVVGSDALVEIDFETGRQIGLMIKKGAFVEVRGSERIKAEGEIYSKDYRIIRPLMIKIEGKDFLIR